MHRTQAAVGYVLAQQFLGDTRDRSGKIVIVFPPDEAASSTALDSFYEAFARAMTRFPGIEVEDRTVSTSVRKAKRGQITAEEFDQAVTVDGKVLAVVSWVGLPVGVSDLPRFRDTASRTPLYLFDPWDKPNWIDSVRSGVVWGGALPLRESADASAAAAAQTPGAIFAAHYRLVTPKNVEEISAASER